MQKSLPGPPPHTLNTRVQIGGHEEDPELVGSRGRVVAIGEVFDSDEDMKLDFFCTENDETKIVVCLTPGETLSPCLSLADACAVLSVASGLEWNTQYNLLSHPLYRGRSIDGSIIIPRRKNRKVCQGTKKAPAHSLSLHDMVTTANTVHAQWLPSHKLVHTKDAQLSEV
jgi:hypothetical protein